MKNLSLKLIAIGVLCLAFVMGMLFVDGLVDERQRYHQDVISEIKEAHVGDQNIITPFLVVQTDAGAYPIFANKSDIQANTNVQDNQYQRGIYHAISYDAKFHIKQNFNLKEITNLPPFTPKTNGHNKTGTPAKATGLKFIVAISDLRGTMPTTLKIGDKSYPLKFATNQSSLLPLYYLQADIDDKLTQLDELTTSIEFSVLGIDSLNLLPLGEGFSSQLHSNWREPKFFGQALPIQKTINQQGFSATWQTNFIAKDNQKYLSDCLANNGNCAGFDPASNGQWLGTAFVKMDDTYAQTDRTIKYALLLALICFGTFFLFETLKGLRIHPIQYGLVGGSLLMFYVLLLSLAEHITFLTAYTIASVACVGLIGWYTCYVLSSIKRGFGFALILGSLYAGFYLILSVSGFNLLLGALFCFVLLATVMYITRHIDWYHLGKHNKAHTNHQP